MKGNAIIWVLFLLFLLVVFGLLTWDQIFSAIRDFFASI